MIEFARLWAFALLPLPVLAWAALPVLKARAAVPVPSSVRRLMAAMAMQTPSLVESLPVGVLLRAVGWLALVVALAGPHLRGQELLEPTGRDLIVAVDLSASMAERSDKTTSDGSSQIDSALDLVGAFIDARRGDRVGLIAFASEAFLIAPLSFDNGAVGEMLKEVTIGLPGRRTDLGQAIGLTVQVLRDQPKAERVMIAVSDGETNAGELAAMDAAALATDAGIKIYMVGFAEEIAVENVELMQDIAAATGGRYFPAADPDALATITAEIAQLLPVSADSDRRVMRDLSWIPLLLAFAALFVIGWREMRGI